MEYRLQHLEGKDEKQLLDIVLEEKMQEKK